MEIRIGDATVHYVEHGRGVPLVALHGAGVDHRETEAALEPLLPHDGYRRIYPDLPGMGESTADGLNGNQDVVALLAEFLAAVGDSEPVLLLGHSYGAYLARGVAARHPNAVAGLALICPIGGRGVGGGGGSLPAHKAVVESPGAHDELAPELQDGFDEYFVIRTPATARRYRDAVVPGTQLVDEAALRRVFSGWEIELGGHPFDKPTLLVAGRRDSTVGFADAASLLEKYPRAALAIVEDAGHALLHEKPEVVGALLVDWLERVAAVSSGVESYS